MDVGGAGVVFIALVADGDRHHDRKYAGTFADTLSDDGGCCGEPGGVTAGDDVVCGVPTPWQAHPAVPGNLGHGIYGANSGAGTYNEPDGETGWVAFRRNGSGDDLPVRGYCGVKRDAADAPAVGGIRWSEESAVMVKRFYCSGFTIKILSPGDQKHRWQC